MQLTQLVLHVLHNYVLHVKMQQTADVHHVYLDTITLQIKAHVHRNVDLDIIIAV